MKRFLAILKKIVTLGSVIADPYVKGEDRKTAAKVVASIDLGAAVAEEVAKPTDPNEPVEIVNPFLNEKK